MIVIQRDWLDEDSKGSGLQFFDAVNIMALGRVRKAPKFIKKAYLIIGITGKFAPFKLFQKNPLPPTYGS